MPKKSAVPSYRLHKASGQARVLIRGRHVYLGKFNSPESREKYRRTLAEHKNAWRGKDRTICIGRRPKPFCCRTCCEPMTPTASRRQSPKRSDGSSGLSGDARQCHAATGGGRIAAGSRGDRLAIVTPATATAERSIVLVTWLALSGGVRIGCDTPRQRRSARSVGLKRRRWRWATLMHRSRRSMPSGI
jgi:hypothetical protein